MAIARHKTRPRELREGRTLARRAQRGDGRAFELLYAAYEGRLYRFCYRLTGSPASAAALVEASFTRGLATLPEHPPADFDVASHLYGTARSLAYERRRNGDPHGLEDGLGRYGEHAREVAAAHRRLAPRQRMTLALRDLDGRPDDEIAAALGAQGEHVPALVARARLRLRSELRLPPAEAGCGERLAELSALADGTLPAARRPELEAHLANCPHCRSALFALQEAKLRYRELPVPEPPGELSSRIATALGAVGLETPRAVAAAAAESAAPGGGRQTTAAVAMAALALVGVGVTVAAARSNGGDPKPAPPAAKRQQPSGPVAASAAFATSSSTAVALVKLHAPPRQRHLRSGPHFSHHAKTVHHVPSFKIGIAPEEPVAPPAPSTTAAAQTTRAKPPAQQTPIPVQIEPSAPQSQAQPASDSQAPAPQPKPDSGPSPPGQTTTT